MYQDRLYDNMMEDKFSPGYFKVNHGAVSEAWLWMAVPSYGTLNMAARDWIQAKEAIARFLLTLSR